MIDWAEAELLHPGPEISYLWEVKAGSKPTGYCTLSKIAFREKRKPIVHSVQGPLASPMGSCHHVHGFTKNFPRWLAQLAEIKRSWWVCAAETGEGHGPRITSTCHCSSKVSRR